MRKHSTALPKPIRSKNPVVILKAVIRAIREEPKRYDQSDIAITRRDDDDDDDDKRNYFPSCGTVACVGGWVNILTKARYPEDLDRAAAKLHLDFDEQRQLFAAKPVGVRSRRRVTATQHAADGIKHIKRFVLKKWGKKI